MRKQKLFLILVMFVVFAQNIFAQNGDLFPLNLGDKFFYKNYVNGQYSGISSFTISDSRVWDGKTYYLHPIWNLYVRFDSTTGIIFVRDSLSTCYYNERVIDSLRSNLNDSIKYCIGIRSKCTYKAQVSMFDSTIWRVGFSTYVSPLQMGASSYFLGFGVASWGSASGHTAYRHDMAGCIIKGRSYGIVSAITVNTNTVPDQYSLSQNYPNPFNPSTKINYELKITNYVTLKVFDLLGKEVATLVNEKQNAGSYAVDFNSEEFNLPSGIYFYTLKAGEFTETRKMVLVK